MTESPAGTPAPQDALGRAVTDLAALDGVDLPDQVAVYERLHAELESALADTVDQPAPPPRGG